VMNEAINVLASSAGESLGDLFIGVVRGSGNNVWTPPLTSLFILSVQSHRHYSYFTFLSTLQGAYQTVTRVPSHRASVWCAARAFGLVDASALFLGLLAGGPSSVRVSEAFIVGPIPTFLSEIKVHGSRFVSQYVQRSSRVMVRKVSWARGLTYVLLGFCDA
jgi:hypothetical protein